MPDDASLTSRFHLAVPVDDLDAARQFYGDVLGLEHGRSAKTWVDWNLMGHQLVTHVAPSGSTIHNPVDGHDVPVPHFGVILAVSEFQDFADRQAWPTPAAHGQSPLSDLQAGLRSV